MDYVKIGKRIKDVRTAKGFTQEYLAEKLGIDPSFVSRIENGHNKGSLETYINICKILDTSLDFLTQDEIIQAHKRIAEQEFHYCVSKLNRQQTDFLIDSIKRFTDYSLKMKDQGF